MSDTQGTRICQECGAIVGPLEVFPAREGVKGIVCFRCYEKRMQNVVITSDDVTAAFVKAINL